MMHENFCICIAPHSLQAIFYLAIWISYYTLAVFTKLWKWQNFSPWNFSHLLYNISRKLLECCLSLTTKPCLVNILMSKFFTSGITHCYDNQVMVWIICTHVALRSPHIIMCLPRRLINITVCRQCIYEYVNILGQLLYPSQEVYTPMHRDHVILICYHLSSMTNRTHYPNVSTFIEFGLQKGSAPPK